MKIKLNIGAIVEYNKCPIAFQQITYVKTITRYKDVFYMAHFPSLVAMLTLLCLLITF